MRQRWWLIGLMMLVTCGCGGSGGTGGKMSAGSGARTAVAPSATASPGFSFTLEQGVEPASVVSPLPVAPAAPLAQPEVDRLLRRLPPPRTADGDRKAFALRERSLPPPVTGPTLPEAFPPLSSADGPPAKEERGPLQVLRHQPDGKVPMAPVLSITFNQPMVALTSHEDLAEKDLPVRLQPSVPGAWRWAGTKTLMFEPKPRFAMATTYTLDVPAGTASATGGKLAKAEHFTFSTPPVSLVSSFPNDGPHVRDPLLYMVFDQKVDPKAVLAHLKITAGAAGSVMARLATEAEIKGDPSASALFSGATADRFVAFKATSLLPADTQVSVSLEIGTPSLEGPLLTESRQSFTFRTYGPLRLTDTNCAKDSECQAGTPLYLSFSNPLDGERFDRSRVIVTPEIPGLQVAAQGSSIVISGRTKGRTTYTVTLDRALVDAYGQTLEGKNTGTFHIGEATASLSVPGGPLVVLDPRGTSALPVYTVNHDDFRVTAYTVTPGDWSSFWAFYHGWSSESPPSPPGVEVMSKVIETHGEPDALTETTIDLSSVIPTGKGHVMLVVEPTTPSAERYLRQKHVLWVQATQIGLTALADHENLTVWATSLADGTPLGSVAAGLQGDATTVTTDANGTAVLALPSASSSDLLVARSGDDVALLPRDAGGYGGGGWCKRTEADSTEWYVFDDRKMYRPGEEVHVKGWVRVLRKGPIGDLSLPAGRGALSWKLVDANGNEVGKGTSDIDTQGGFDFKLALGKTMNLGQATLQLDSSVEGAPMGSTLHAFQVQEFRRPEFEVSAQSGEGPFFVGEGGDMSVNARYYAGGGLPGAPVTWTVSAVPGSYSPPGWSEFTFGTWTPWWGIEEGPVVMRVGGGFAAPRSVRAFDEEPLARGVSADVRTLGGRTDINGKHRLHLAFQSVSPSRPMSLSAQATVQDVNRQAWTARTSMLVHPASLYVGLRSERLFARSGEPIPLRFIVCDINGKAVANRPVHLRLRRLEYSWDSGRVEEIEVDARDRRSGAEEMADEIVPPEGGEYRLEAEIEDDKGRRNRSEITFWVPGGKQIPERSVTRERVTLVPDRKDYAVGDTAHVMVAAPFPAAKALLTVRRNDIIDTRVIDLDAGSGTFEVPITESMIPNVFVQVDVVGEAVRIDDSGKPNENLPKRTAYASGKLDLSVPPAARTLSVKAAPKETRLDPGGETDVVVDVHDATGAPVGNSQVAVVVVDEAVLALSQYTLVNPLSVFYPRRSDDVADAENRGYVRLDDPAAVGRLQAAPPMAEEGAPVAAAPGASLPRGGMMERKSASADSNALEGGAQGDDAASSAPIRIRTDFNPLALFAPRAVTDSSGRATVHVKLPDNLTRYRVMAVAVAGDKQFGLGEDTLTARLPLMARPSAPRFLNFGDAFEMPLVLQNQTDRPMTVDVAVRATNAALPQGGGRRVTVPANDRVEVRFPTVTDEAGTARFQFVAAAVGAKGSDAAEISLPVWTPATTEAFATYGEIDENGAVAQPVAAPSKVFPQFGGLEVTTSSTQLQTLTDAVLYLVTYPFECGEQVSSRVLSIAALKDVLGAFKAEGLPPADALIGFVGRDIEKLRALQCADGGFALWNRDELEMPFVSVHVTHALVMAEKKGFAVPKDVLGRAKGYLQTIESHYPMEYSQAVRRAITAYALYVRHLMGDDDAAKARALITEAGGVDKMPMEALGWLLMVLSKQKADVSDIRTHLANHVTEEAGTAHFVTRYEEGTAYILFGSDRRTDAVLLEALIEDSPKSDLIPKIVRGLLAHRVKGHWANTQEDTFILLALDRYFNTYEKVTPDFVARLWLGRDFAGEHRFRGRTTERRDTRIPMAWLAAKGGTPTLVLDKQGPGRLYYRLGMQYAPRNLRLEPSEHGFSVERVYEAMDNPDDVRREADGTWTIKAGARVRVRITMVATARRYHVALVDPLPAGLEAVNPVLAVSGSEPATMRQPSALDGRPCYAWSGGWYEHQNLRDERAEAFCSLLWDGVYTFEYACRATTPGRFVAPPAKAEEMYAPETFGRGASDIVIVR